MTCPNSARISNGSATVTSYCTCSPSCLLFPRRWDGKVVLPNPTNLQLKERPSAPTEDTPSTSASLEEAQEKHNRTTDHMTCTSKTAPCHCPDCVLAITNSDQPLWTASLSPAKFLDAPTEPVESYAQLSSLPEFKAFKLDQDGQLVSRGVGHGNHVPRKKNGTEWMREIRVVRRTKKQSYVRSGTHDFCIRLYTGQSNLNED